MTATHVRTQYYLLELTELIPSVELVLNVNQITHRIELELELMPKNHQNPSPDSDPALELIQHYCRSADLWERKSVISLVVSPRSLTVTHDDSVLQRG